jgi:hypothetical protein
MSETKSHTQRNRSSTKCGCDMGVLFTPLLQDADEEGAVKEYEVEEASFEHTGGCSPGEAQQRVLARVSTSGCKVPIHVLQQLAEAMRMHPNTRQIRTFLASHSFKRMSGVSQSFMR